MIDPRVIEALARREKDEAQAMPEFARIWKRISASPSPMDSASWGPARSLRVAGGLVLAQMRVVPWLVVPIAVVAAAMAVLVGEAFGIGHAAPTGTSAFVTMMLVGAIATVVMGLSPRVQDAVTLVTPVGPRVVLTARVAMVLGVDVLCGLLASALVSWADGSFATLVVTWLAPLAAISGLVTFLSVWTAPWVGSLIGVCAVPLLVPLPVGSMSIGIGGFAEWLQEHTSPVAVLILGGVLLALAIALAPRPHLRAQAAV